VVACAGKVDTTDDSASTAVTDGAADAPAAASATEDARAIVESTAFDRVNVVAAAVEEVIDPEEEENVLPAVNAGVDRLGWAAAELDINDGTEVDEVEDNRGKNDPCIDDEFQNGAVPNPSAVEVTVSTTAATVDAVTGGVD